MDLATMTAIILATAGVLIVAMAGLIKSMLGDTLKEMKDDLKAMRAEYHTIEKRLSILERDHDSGYCKYHGIDRVV
jgi:hypothetical protein